MNRFIVLGLLACLLLFPVALPAEAAPAKMDVQVQIENPEAFWNSAYYMTGKTPTKPLEVKLEWSVGDFGKPSAVTIVTGNKDNGRYLIATEKGDTVNLRIYLTNSKKEAVASWNIQVLNKGQTEIITITPPTTVQPEFIRS